MRLTLISLLLVAGAAGAAQAAQQPSAEELKAAVAGVAAPTYAALVLPVAALATPDVARSVAPIVIDPESGVALEGYDPVGYFTENRPTPGKPEFMAEYRGAMFFFASEENRARFVADPGRYAPAYGGYCTETLAAGALTQASPLNWAIHGDRLYLTRSPRAAKEFREHAARSVEAADRYWAASGLDDDQYNFRPVARP